MVLKFEINMYIEEDGRRKEELLIAILIVFILMILQLEKTYFIWNLDLYIQF
jgi:hypothetical protein